MRHEVRHDEAVNQLADWWSSSQWVPEVREVAGPPRSGRTGLLRALGDGLPDAVTIDVTGMTAEELEAAILDRPEGAEEFRRSLILLLNVHRAGRTRRSSHPRRIIESRLDELAHSRGLGIVVEIDDAEDYFSEDRNRYVVSPAESEGVPADVADCPPEVRALALAEGRAVPLSVWRVLVASTTSRTPDEEDLRRIVAQHRDLVSLDRDYVTFADESLACVLREAGTPEEAVNAHRAVLSWLLDATPHMQPAAVGETPVRSAIAEYSAVAAAMHATCAGDFERLLRSGMLLALLSQDALLDAASCLPRGSVVDNLASDAFYAHAYGVGTSRSGEQSEWVPWLHLFASARGEPDMAGEIWESSVANGHVPSWRCRWAHWRPPGSWQPRFIEPGPVSALAHVIWRDRSVVLGWGEFQDAVRPIWMWDAATGDLLAPAFETTVPDEILAAITWPDGREGNLTSKALAYDAARSYREGPDPDWLPCAVTVNGTLVLAGPGGVFAVDPVSPTTSTALPPTRDPESIWHYRGGAGPAPTDLLSVEHAALQKIYAPDAVVRVHPERLPAGLRDDAARSVLSEVGLPLTDIGGLRLVIPDDGELRTVTWPHGEQTPDAEGPFFHIGRWWGGSVVIDGTSGMVLRAQAEDEPADWSPDRVVASDLPSFVKMLQLRGLGSHFMAMAPRDPEQVDLRYQLEEGLEVIDERGAESPAWMRGLLRDSVW